MAVHLGAAGAALAGLAVPAAGEVRLLRLLDPVDDVENDHALFLRDVIVDVLAPGVVAPPDLEVIAAAQWSPPASARSAFSSGGGSGSGSVRRLSSPPV